MTTHDMLYMYVHTFICLNLIHIHNFT